MTLKTALAIIGINKFYIIGFAVIAIILYYWLHPKLGSYLNLLGIIILGFWAISPDYRKVIPLGSLYKLLNLTLVGWILITLGTMINIKSKHLKK